MKRSIKPVRAAVAAFALALLFAAAAGAQDEERPRIFLEKKVFSEDAEGKKSFYEAHTVSRGESLWKILSRRAPVDPEDYAETLREFRRVNPAVPDPSRLRPGQKILVPARPVPAAPEPVPGKSEAYRVARGDTLSGILSARGVRRNEMPGYMNAVKALNPALKDVNLIRTGRTLMLPTKGFFAPEPEVPSRVAAAMREAPSEPPAPAAPASPKAEKETPPGIPAPVAAQAKEDSAEIPAPESRPEKGRETPPPAIPPTKEAPKEAPPPVVAAMKEAPAGLPAPAAPAEPKAEKEKPPPAVPLTKEAPREAPPEIAPPAKPEGELKTAPAIPATAPAVIAKAGEKPPQPKPPEEFPPALPKPPYRGLLYDLLRGLGEKWADRGTLYLPITAGGEIVLSLEDYPVARFSTGISCLIDFRGGIPPDVRDLIGSTWKGYRVVSMDGAAGPDEMIDRLLRSAGYHSVKDGRARPVVVGEAVAVTIPARWVILKTPDSLSRGDVILVKEVPEKPSRELAAVIRYGEEVGIRILGIATDTSAREGFLVGIEEEGEAPPSTPLHIPPGGLPAVDFALEFAGLGKKEGAKIDIGGKDKAFQLTVQADRIFEAGGRKFVVDAGQMAPALRSLVRGAGYEVISVGRTESGRDVFLKILRAAGIATEERRSDLVAGGPGPGFEVRVSGTFVTSPGSLAARKAKAAALVRGKVHSATSVFLRSLGMEIVGW